jgi:hypothetical protein
MMKEKVFYQEWFIILSFLFVFFFFFVSTITAQTRRALLVGINNYKPKEPIKELLCRKGEDVKNLCGCLNDVEAMKGILISRFYFKPGNIHVLINEHAARDNILSGIVSHLIKEAAPGDVCVFYFAGHGSWVKNSKSIEPDKKDETLVPADWYRNGDIRDKELKKLFNRILDKKANLTVIVDSCYSGSISRGIPSYLQYRAIPGNECDAAEPPDSEKEPAERGALILSAARDFQYAVEDIYENNSYYGLFTWALIKVLRSVPFDEPVGNIFLQVNAYMQSESMNCMLRAYGDPSFKLHDPNLESLVELRNRPLFGTKPGKDNGILVGVIDVRGKTIKLRAGYALGVSEDCVLRKFTGNGAKSKVRVRVTKVYGLNLCQAEVVDGDAGEIKCGDMFEIYRWVAPREARMKVWIPHTNLSHEQLLHIARETASLKNPGNIQWLDDPTETNPTHIMSWFQSSWRIECEGNVMELGKHPKADAILEKIRSSHQVKNEKPRFFLFLPLSSEIKTLIAPEIKYYNDSISILPSVQGAHYVLVGRLVGDEITYAWVHTNITREEGKGLPIRTRWFAVQKEGEVNRRAVIEMWDKLLNLVKIKAWMNLSSPPDKGNFPYRLALKNAKTGEITTSGPLIEDERYGFVLRAYKEIQPEYVRGRYVYVFSINSHGEGRLLFPPHHRRNSENHFPVTDGFQNQIQLWDKDLFYIGEPFGLDTYILLTTEEAIDHPEVLDFKGVRRELPTGNQYNALERLLYGLGSGFRGRIPDTYTNWSIQQMSILSKPKEK